MVKNNSTSSKLLIGTALAVLLVFAVSNSAQLTGWQVAAAGASTNLSIEPVTLDSIQVNGNNRVTCSFSTLRFTSSRSDAFRFGAEQTNRVWFLIKNRTRGCNSFNGNWIFINSSSAYTLARAGYFLNIYSLRNRDGVTSTIRYYYPNSTYAPLKVQANGRYSPTSLGNTTYVNVTIRDGYGLFSGTFRISGVFGAGSSNGIPSATDLSFRDALGLVTAGKINYTYANQTAIFQDSPFCSQRGSCIIERSNLAFINYANRSR